MCHRAAVRSVAVVLAALCGVSAGQEDVPSLVHNLKATDVWTRRRAAATLGKVGPAAKEAVPALIAALEGGDRKLRWTATTALGKIGPAARDAVPALEAAAGHGSEEAESALKKIRGER